METVELKINVPKEKPDENWTGWDHETFNLREHLAMLIKSYGIKILKSELDECFFTLKNK